MADRRRNRNRPATAGPDTHVVRVEAGTDLAHFLADRLGNAQSVRAIRRLLESGCCRVNGQVETFGSRRLRRGDQVDCPPPGTAADAPRFDRRRLLYDEEGVIVYDKPPGLPVTPTASGKDINLEELFADVGDHVKAAHRLDADTSGLVLLARNEDTAIALVGMFREHAVQKTYEALVRGVPPSPGERRSYLVCQEKSRGRERWGTGRAAEAKEAVTRWKVLEILGAHASRIQVEPATGRTHQVRVHLSEIGCPLIGDRIYGDRRDPVDCPRQMLHASRIVFDHPVTGKKVKLSAKIPADFRAVMAALRAMK